MSTLDTIHGFLACSETTAADEALLLALDRAEAPYTQSIVETLLVRGRAHAMAALIHRLPNLGRPLQRLCLEKVNRLAAGLFRAASHPDPLTRRTCLKLIRHHNLPRLAELPALLLRDPDGPTAQAAGQTLLHLARRAQAEAVSDVSHRSYDRVRGRVGQLSDAQDRLQAALQTAINNFSIHRHLDAVKAAMTVAPATNVYFWRAHLEPYTPVGRAVRTLLLDCDHPSLAHFVVSALGHPGLRAVAAKAVATHQNDEYVAAIAHESVLFGGENVLFGLKLVRFPRWITQNRFDFACFPAGIQGDFLQFLMEIDVSDGDRVGLLSRCAMSGAPGPAVRAVRVLAGFERGLCFEFLPPLTKAPLEAVALTAVAHLRRLGYPHLRRLVVELLGSPHRRLNQWARKYLGDYLFRRYWEAFALLADEQRRRAGRALFKADPQAYQRLERCSRSRAAVERLRVVQIARTAGVIDGHVEMLLRLMADDNSRVRSCATAALGEAKGVNARVKSRLVRALGDSDDRVRANAIEALGTLCGAAAAPACRALAGDRSNRVRANAIMVLLRHELHPGASAIRAMLQDRRAAHQRSAQWVTQALAQVRPEEEGFKEIRFVENKELSPAALVGAAGTLTADAKVGR